MKSFGIRDCLLSLISYTQCQALYIARALPTIVTSEMLVLFRPHWFLCLRKLKKTMRCFLPSKDLESRNSYYSFYIHEIQLMLVNEYHKR